MSEEIKNHRRIFNKEIENAVMHYSSAKGKHNEVKAEKWREHIIAFEYAKKKADYDLQHAYFGIVSTDELFDMLAELHKNCLYRLGPDDDRVTHVPHELFDKVEKMLARRK